MKNVFIGTTTTLLLVSAFNSVADSSCDRLIQHGIINITRYQSANHAIAYKWSKYCGLDYNSASDVQVANASATVFGYGSGEAGYSSNQQRTKLVEWCDANANFAESRSDLAQEAELLSAPALDSWEQCIEMTRKQINIKFKPSGENDEFVHFEIDSTFDGNIKYFGVTSTNYVCTEKMVNIVDGATLNIKQHPDITNANIQIDCTRSQPKISEAQGIGIITFDQGYIAVNTSGPSFSTSFPKVVSQYHVTPPGAVLAFDSEACPPGWRPFTSAESRFVLGASPNYKVGDVGGTNKHTHSVQQGSEPKASHIQGNYFDFSTAVHDAETMPPYIALRYCKRN